MTESAKKPTEAIAAPSDIVELHPKLEQQIDRIVESKLAQRIAALEAKYQELGDRVGELEENQISDRVTLVVFSGDFDRLMAAFIIATGAAAMGMEVSMYFTFWGLTALKKKTVYSNKNILEKMVSVMMPTGPGKAGTSRLNMLGMGPAFFKQLMKRNNVETLPDLIQLARELDVKMIACLMSMGVMGIKKEELWDDLVYGGVATYLGDATDSKTTLFV